MSQTLLVDPCDSKSFMNSFQFLPYEVFWLYFVPCNNDLESSAVIFHGSFPSAIGSHDWNDYRDNCGVDGFLMLFESSHQ